MAENGGIYGTVNYAATRPFDDASQMIQQPWQPYVSNVTVNLYQEAFAADGVTPTLTMVDTTTTSSWGAWAQGFYPNITSGTSGGTAATGHKPYMSCPGQDTATNDLFFFTLFDQPNYLDWYNSEHNGGTLHTLPYNSQFKCYDAMKINNQLQPAPYDGKCFFPSTLGRDPSTGKLVSTVGSTNGVTGLPRRRRPLLASTASYWDIGVRGDKTLTGHESGFRLNPTYSMLDDPGYASSNLTTNPSIVSQYCNGTRVPPACASAGCGGPTGYGVPPGIVDASAPNPVFTLTPAATVDEGNNWINVSWGPLALSDDSVKGGTNGNYGGAALFANYALNAGSPAIDYVPVSQNHPTLDFFGNQRPDPEAVGRREGSCDEKSKCGWWRSAIGVAFCQGLYSCIDLTSPALCLAASRERSGPLSSGHALCHARSRCLFLPSKARRPLEPVINFC